MVSLTLSVIGLLLCLPGLLVVVGTSCFPEALAAFFPPLAYIGANVAAGFLLTGIALILPGNARWVRSLRLLLGGAVLLLATAALLENSFDWYPSAPALRHVLGLEDDSRLTLRWPSAMATPAAFEFIVYGAALAAMSRVRKPGFGLLIQLALCIAILAAVLGTLSSMIGHAPFDASWTDADAANLLATIGMIPLGIGLLLLSCRAAWFRSFYRGHEDRRVFALSAVLTSAIAVVAALLVACVLAKNCLSSFQEILSTTHRANTLLFRQALDSASMQARATLQNSRLGAILDSPAAPDVAALNEEMRRLTSPDVDEHFSSIVAFSTAWRRFAADSRSNDAAELRIPLDEPSESWLIWRNGWLLEMRLPVFRKDRHVANVLVEKPLPLLQLRFDYARQLGRTGEVLACAMEGRQMACFPSRLVQKVHREPITYGGELVPMGRTLMGQHGVEIGHDYRGVRVVSAFGMVANTPIGLVQKIDIDDLASSIGKQMWHAIAFLLLLSIAGGLLFARVVRPIVFDLMRTRKQLAAVLDNVPSAVLTTDGEGVIESANLAAEKIFEAPPGALAGRHVAELFPDIAMTPPLTDESGAPSSNPTPTWGKRMNGPSFPAEVSMGSLAVDGRRHLICVARDLTGVKAVEAVLRESEERLQAIASNIPGMVFQCTRKAEDGGVQFTYVSKGVGPLLGMDAEAVYADPRAFLSRMSETDAQRFNMAMERSAQSLAQWDWEGQIVRQAGRCSWISLRATPRHNDNGDVIWDGVVFDITSMKKNEENLQKSSTILRQLSAHMEAAREEERKRIAREVHDELSQTLTALRMEVSMVKLDLAPQNPELMERVKSMMSLLDRTIKTTRHVLTSLRPPALDLGIAAALEWLVTGFSSHSGINARFTQADSEISLDEHQAITVFRIVQEALTNVARHSGATEASVIMRPRGDRVRIEIADNGVGFNSDREEKRKSFGLVGIRERVLMLGGSVTIDSGVGKGTTVAVEIPLRSEHPEPINETFI